MSRTRARMPVGAANGRIETSQLERHLLAPCRRSFSVGILVILTDSRCSRLCNVCSSGLEASLSVILSSSNLSEREGILLPSLPRCTVAPTECNIRVSFFVMVIRDIHVLKLFHFPLGLFFDSDPFPESTASPPVACVTAVSCAGFVSASTLVSLSSCMVCNVSSAVPFSNCSSRVDSPSSVPRSFLVLVVGPSFFPRCTVAPTSCNRFASPLVGPSPAFHNLTFFHTPMPWSSSSSVLHSPRSCGGGDGSMPNVRRVSVVSEVPSWMTPKIQGSRDRGSGWIHPPVSEQGWRGRRSIPPSPSHDDPSNPRFQRLLPRKTRGEN